jgi:putative acetyltransferase
MSTADNGQMSSADNGQMSSAADGRIGSADEVVLLPSATGADIPQRSATPVTVHIVEWTHPDAESLRALQRLEIAERYGRDDSEPGPAPTADDIAVFMVAYSPDGQPVACGGLRQLDDAIAEIKRMFVTPSSRGSGASVAVLQHLEQYALERGWDRLRLETGTAQPDAIRFYEREGYQLIERYGHYVHSADSICYEKVL